ncbi:MAG: hypothetical protein AMXMBFR84_10860 [Candidatus Hydrogenedentota bacterium]
MKAIAPILCIGLLAALAPANASEACDCCKDKKSAVNKVAVCKDYQGDTAFASDVWWGHKERSFGNYIQFAKAEIPAPRVAPDYGIIYFDLDKSVLKPEGVAIADKVLAHMQQYPEDHLLVEGHCCDLATNEYNMKLGQRRADAVKKYLVEHGIAADRIETVSYGEEKRTTNGKAERPLNRRAVPVICISAGEPAK